MSVDRSPKPCLTAAQTDRIIARAAEMYGIEPSDVTGQRRQARFSRPRFAAAYAMRRHGMAFVQIGYRLGDRDHATIRAACEKAAIYAQFEPGYGIVLEEVTDAAA